MNPLNEIEFSLGVWIFRNLGEQDKHCTNMHVKTWNDVKWTMPVIKDLIDTLKEYTAIMEFNNSDFDAEEPRQYEKVSYNDMMKLLIIFEPQLLQKTHQVTC